MPLIDNITFNLIFEFSLFNLYALPFIFNPLENFFLFFVFEYALSNFHFFPFSFDFLADCFFGSSECQSVEVYVEMAEGGGSWICEKNWDCYAIDSKGTRHYPITPMIEAWSPPQWLRDQWEAERLMELEELREAGLWNPERSEALENTWIERRPQYPGDIYIGDTYIPERDIPSWEEAGEMDSTHPWLLTKPKVSPPKYCHAIMVKL